MYQWNELREIGKDDFSFLIRRMSSVIDRWERGDIWKRNLLRGGRLFPLLNVQETSNAYVVTTQAPGMELDNLEIRIDGDTLYLKGELGTNEFESPEASYHRKERLQGSFQRSVVLPERVDYQEAHAAYKNGTLTITIPKSSGSAAKRIEITS